MSVQEIDAQVLSIIRQLGEPDPKRVIAQARTTADLGAASESDILGAVWRLIEQKKAELTTERRLRVA